ncbi:MAG: glycosyltransferase, partial [Anaerolineaceae bacterium]|nr:glycosyltransferase [Anaerolineaceae bacterium]
KFIFLGDGKEKKKLLAYAKSLKLFNVEFLNSVPKSEISQYFAAADTCIAILKPIELYKTTYPNKVFDYMAAAKPIILAIDGVIRKVVESAGCGIFCQPGNPEAIANAVIQMYNKSDLKKMGKHGQHYLQKNFNRKLIAKDFSDMIEKMIVIDA